MFKRRARPSDPTQQNIHSPRGGVLPKLLSFKIVLVLWAIIGIIVYVMTAPPADAPDDPPKLQFHGRSALRKRPSTHSAPIAYTKNGDFLFSFESKEDGRLGIYSEDLHGVFEVSGVSLSENITLSTEEKGKGWVITDPDRKQAYGIFQNSQIRS